MTLNSKLNEDAGDSGVNDAAQKAADDILADQARAQREAEALALTEESVVTDVLNLSGEGKGTKASPAALQVILEKIAFHPDDDKRMLLFVAVETNLVGKALKGLVDRAQKRANKDWSNRRKDEAHVETNNHKSEPNPFEFYDEEEAVKAISEKCAMVWYNGGVRYVFWDADGFPVFGYKRDAEDWFDKYQLVEIIEGRFPKWTSAFLLWKKSQHRREYNGVGFYPDAAKARADFLNLWTGFAIAPAAADSVNDWSLLRAHIFENICQRNQEHFDYLMDWMSQMVFEPGRKSGVIPVLRGKPGTGKTKLGEWLSRIIGEKHSVELTHEQHLSGNFNAHIENMLFIAAEEAFFAADPKSGKVLKTIATSPSAVYENKGKDIRKGISCCRVMMFTNSDWAVPIEADDRRYFVLDVAETHMKDKPYFAAIDVQMESGGAAAMLCELLERKMTFGNLSDAPMTEGKREQIRHSMNVKDKWLASVLTDGQFPVKNDFAMHATDWPKKGGSVAKATVLASYQDFVSGYRGSPTQEEVALFLKKYFGTVGKTKITLFGKRVPHYVLPPLEEARKAFQKITPNYDFEPDEGDDADDACKEENVVPLRRRASRF